jgi:hypothetical protein
MFLSRMNFRGFEFVKKKKGKENVLVCKGSYFLLTDFSEWEQC